jgi:hypothetical protein
LAEMKREADRLWSLLVRRRAGDRCECPLLFGRCLSAATDAAHIFRRGISASRFDLDNGIALCRHHHETLGSAIVGKRTLMRDVIEDMRGWDLYERIEALAAQHGKFKPQTLAGLKECAAAMGIK